MAKKPAWYPAAADAYWVQWWNGKSWAEAYWPIALEGRSYMPDAERVDISSPGEPRLDIVGEAYRTNEILAAIGMTSSPPRDQEFEGFTTAELVPEPDNPFDRHAVSVRLGGHCVGYLSAEDVTGFFPIISRFVESGVVPTVRTRIWGVTRFVRGRNRDELKCAIRVALSTPADILPVNGAPSEPYFVAPAGRRIQVTGEQDHFDVLKRFQKREGRYIATLHAIAGKTASSAKLLEVRLDGERVGQLTPAMSLSIFPMVESAAAQGRTLAAWAEISGSHLAAEVTLRISKADQVPSSWPSDSDVVPHLGSTSLAIPDAWEKQREIVAPPGPTGLKPWLWVSGLIFALILFAVPFVGWLLGIVLIALLAWLHSNARRRAPKGAHSSLPRAGTLARGDLSVP